MSPDAPRPAAVPETGIPVPFSPPSVPTLVQIPEAELTELRRGAEKYRFLFKTIITVTCILVGATLIVVLAAILTDM